ncbi:unnamed protein product [Closterium sp. NIES-65]|nr:unnamed protein product [Closterium sp. NIES-65]
MWGPRVNAMAPKHHVNAMASKHHPNLVRLLGFCIDFNADTEEMEQVVVYEFMENGDLDRWIGDEAPKALSLLERVNIFIEAPKPLSLLERVDILIGAAHGLEHLHLRRLKSLHHYLLPTFTSLPSPIRGTEAALPARAFGVVMLAVITAQHAVRTQQDTSRVNLKAWVAPLVSAHDVASFKDPRLEGPADVILRLAELALSCTAMPTASRPDMMRIIGGLKAMRAELTGGDVDERAIRIDSELAIGVGETLEEQIMRVESMGDGDRGGLIEDTPDVPVLLDCQALWIRNFTGWTTGEDCATAEGLQCDSNGMIVKMSMEMSSLAGVLPSSIGNPTHPMHLTDQRPFRCSPPSPTTHAPFSSPQVNGDVVSCRGAAVVHQQPDAPHASDRPAPFSLLSPLSNHTRSLLFPSGQWRCRLLQGSMEMSSLAGVLPSSISNPTHPMHLTDQLPFRCSPPSPTTHAPFSSPQVNGDVVSCRGAAVIHQQPDAPHASDRPAPFSLLSPLSNHTRSLLFPSVDSKHTSYPFPHPPPVTTPHPSPLRCPTFFFPFLSSFPSLHPFLPLYPSLASPLLSLTPPLPHPSSPSPLLSFTPPLPHPSSPSPLLSLTPPLPHPSSPSPLLSFTPPLPHSSSSPSPLLSLTPPLPHPSPPLNHSSSRPSPYRNFFRNNLNSGITTTFGALTIPPPCMLLPIRSSHCLALSSPPVLITPPSNLFQTNLFDSDVPTTIGASTSPTTLSLISSPNPSLHPFAPLLPATSIGTILTVTSPPPLALSQSHHLASPCQSAPPSLRFGPRPSLPTSSLPSPLPSHHFPSNFFQNNLDSDVPTTFGALTIPPSLALSQSHHLAFPCLSALSQARPSPPPFAPLLLSPLPLLPATSFRTISTVTSPPPVLPALPSPPIPSSPLYLSPFALLNPSALTSSSLSSQQLLSEQPRQRHPHHLWRSHQPAAPQSGHQHAHRPASSLPPHPSSRLEVLSLHFAPSIRFPFTPSPPPTHHSNLGINMLTGPLPLFLDTLSLLTFLNLGDNKLTGTLSAGLGNLKQLQFLDLSKNNGPVQEQPTGITRTPHLHSQVILRASPTSCFPVDPCLSRDLSKNNVSASLPSTLGSLSTLTWLSTPSSTTDLKALPHHLSLIFPARYPRYSDLQYNALENSIPSSITNLTGLTYLNLASNKLNGSVPVFDGFPALTYLRLNSSSPACVPTFPCSGLGGNSLQGTFPVTGNQALPLTECFEKTQSAWEGTAFKAPSLSRATRLFPSRHSTSEATSLAGGIFLLILSPCSISSLSETSEATSSQAASLAPSPPSLLSSICELVMGVPQGGLLIPPLSSPPLQPSIRESLQGFTTRLHHEPRQPKPTTPLDHSPPPPSTTPHHPPRPLPTTPLDHSPPPPSTTPHRPPRPLPTTPLLAPLSRFLCRLLSENRFNGFLPYSL